MSLLGDVENNVTAAAPVAGGLFGPTGVMATQGGMAGGINGITDRFAGMDPTKAHTSDFNATPAMSNFQAQAPGLNNTPNFAQMLSNTQNGANMGFTAGPNGSPSFVQGLMGNYNQSQGQQQQLINQLQGQSMGQGPGSQLSNNFLHQAQDTNAANAMGLMSSQKGINPAMAARMAGNQSAMGNQQAAGQAANLNLQQQLAAQGQLGGILNQNQNANANLFNAQTGMSSNQFGQALGANQQNNALMSGNNMDAQRLNQLTQSQNAANAMGAQGINAGTANANTAARTQTGGGILGGLGSIGGMAAMAAADGGKVPGVSPHNGDDVKNDTVHTMLSPGEIVIPRSAANDRDKAIKFLDALKSGDGTWGSKKRSKK